ncbi:MAG: ABC transporter ATP-binding protein [Lachnospiraceae bacterium]|nr:ABC transporter ATP-binding protein [Lachnospiraceae bacterium]
MEELMIKIDNVTKQYKLGQIGGTTLRDEMQRLNARIRHKEDPTKKIGAKDYNRGETFMALNGVSFEVRKGERVGIIGHNGAGKSTLLKLLSRVTAPTSGEIGLNGRIASMLEVGTGFHPELTGRENVYMNGAILGMTKKEIDAKIEDIIEFSECRQFIDTPVKRYSSGMYVKLAFSVAAHLDSEIMIMDEVLAVGDMAFQQKCLDKMNDVSRKDGRTILYVSHNMNTIRQLCDRVVVLDHGTVIFDGDVEEGIKVYSSAFSNSSYSLDYSTVPRLSWLKNTKVKCLYAEYIGKNNIIFTGSEAPRLLLRWKNEEDITNLCLRIEIKTTDRTPIATAVCFDFYSGNKGETGESVFRLNISSLTSGEYNVNYTFFLKDSLGGNIDVDCVRGLSLIRETADCLIWNRKNWGAIQLPNLEAENV